MSAEETVVEPMRFGVKVPVMMEPEPVTETDAPPDRVTVPGAVNVSPVPAARGTPIDAPPDSTEALT